MLTFADYLKRIRKSLDLEPYEMAKKLKISNAEYKRLESGDRKPDDRGIKTLVERIDSEKPVKIDLEKMRYDLALLYAQKNYSPSTDPLMIDGIKLDEHMTIVNELENLTQIFGKAYKELNLVGDHEWLIKLGLMKKEAEDE